MSPMCVATSLVMKVPEPPLRACLISLVFKCSVCFLILHIIHRSVVP